MYLNNTNREKNLKDTKRMVKETDTVNFIITVEEFMRVIGRITKWMDTASYFMRIL
jgi:hypothetical protein